MASAVNLALTFASHPPDNMNASTHNHQLPSSYNCLYLDSLVDLFHHVSEFGLSIILLRSWSSVGLNLHHFPFSLGSLLLQFRFRPSLRYVYVGSFAQWTWWSFAGGLLVHKMRKLRELQVVVVAHKMEAHNNIIISNAPGFRILQVLNPRPSDDFKKRKEKKWRAIFDPPHQA